MALKSKYQKKEEIPAADAAHYIERGGVWVLDAEGFGDVEELRASHATTLKELNEHKARFDGIDPDEFRKVTEEKRKLEEERQLKAGEFDKVLETREKAIRAEMGKQVSTANAERDSLSSQLVAIRIDQGVVTAASKRGLRATAHPDITSRARSIFKLVNGVPTAFEADGQTVRPGKDGATPMTLEDWVDSQVAEAPHLFESSAGGGAAGNGAGGASSSGSLKNPWRKEPGVWNLTEQMRLERTDPQRAAQMKTAAGVRV